MIDQTTNKPIPMTYRQILEVCKDLTEAEKDMPALIFDKTTKVAHPIEAVGFNEGRIDRYGHYHPILIIQWQA